MSEYEYSNGADGTCQTCGAEQRGWRRANRAAIEFQNADRERVTFPMLLARVVELERVVALLDPALRPPDRLHLRRVA